MLYCSLIMCVYSLNTSVEDHNWQHFSIIDFQSKEKILKIDTKKRSGTSPFPSVLYFRHDHDTMEAS